jgi:hypothetical protein
MPVVVDAIYLKTFGVTILLGPSHKYGKVVPFRTDGDALSYPMPILLDSVVEAPLSQGSPNKVEL